MRKALFLAAVLVACAKAETPPSDTASTMAPPPPRNLTAADLAGSWKGVSKMEGSDSVTTRWTLTSTSDSTGTIVYDGTTTPVTFTNVIAGDSTVATSSPFVLPGSKPGAPKVIFKSVGRVEGGKFVGTSTLHLATNPDSVVGRRTFEATRP